MRTALRGAGLAATAALLVALGTCAGLKAGTVPADLGTELPLAPSLPPTPALEPPLTESDAVDAYYGGDLEGAIRVYRDVLEREPDSASARRNLARVLRDSGRPLEALEELERLLVQVPDQDPDAEMLRLAAAETAVLARLPERALGYLGYAEPEAAGEPGGGPDAEAVADLRAEAWYLAGLALIDLGRPAAAAAALGSAVEQRPFHPMGWYRLGALHFDLQMLEGAEAELDRALSQDRNLTAAFLPLARIYLGDGRTEKAYGLLRRAQGSLPGNQEVRGLLEELLLDHPELAVQAQASAQLRREAATPRRADSFPLEPESLPVLRIGLAEKVLELHLKTGGPFSLSTPTGRSGPLDGGTVLSVRLVDGELEVTAPELLVRCSGALVLSYDDPADTTILFDVHFGQGTFWAGSEDRTYRGAIELVPHPEGLTVINSLSIEEYLYSVLPSEMPASWPIAALEAQAVAARSYTLANLGRFASRGFDLMGTVASAAYRGMGSENARVRSAVDSTRGLALFDGDRPLSAFYSANSGGHTETTEHVWGFRSSLPAMADPLLGEQPRPLPPEELARWLGARPVTHSSHPSYSNRSAYRWSLWVPRREIETRLGQGEKLGSVVLITAVRRGVSGRIPEVRVRGTAGEHTIRWDAIRSSLGGLRSNLFVVEAKLGTDGLPEYFVFTGAGWGHGVGMCQSGAAGMAAAGFDPEAILNHYYVGATLRKLY